MKAPIVNVGMPERLVAGVLAGYVLGRVLRKPSLLGLFGLGCLLYRTFTGNCKGYEWCGISTCSIDRPR